MNQVSNSDLNFIKGYFKDKKNYSSVGVLESDKYDCNKRQAPKKTFLKINRTDYSFAKQCKRIRRNLPKEQSDILINEVIDINDFTEAKITSWDRIKCDCPEFVSQIGG